MTKVKRFCRQNKSPKSADSKLIKKDPVLTGSDSKNLPRHSCHVLRGTRKCRWLLITVTGPWVRVDKKTETSDLEPQGAWVLLTDTELRRGLQGPGKNLVPPTPWFQAYETLMRGPNYAMPGLLTYGNCKISVCVLF